MKTQHTFRLLITTGIVLLLPFMVNSAWARAPLKKPAWLEKKGICGNQPIDDNNRCTKDSCVNGVVKHDPVKFDDGNACTADSCTPAVGVVNTPLIIEDDGLAWTIDSCDPKIGMKHIFKPCLSLENGGVQRWNLETGKCQAVTRELVAGATHYCALEPNGTVSCWGANLSGQSGDPSSTFVEHPKQVQGLPAVVRLVAGMAHTCAVAANGTVYCWGANFAKQLGITKVEDAATGANKSAIPLAVPQLQDIVDISAGDKSTCALTANEAIQCWGGGATNLSLSFIKGITSLGNSDNHACAVMKNHTVQCWGSNDFGQIGTGQFTPDFHSAPQNVVSLPSGKSVEPKYQRSYAITIGGEVYSWGSNTFEDPLGLGTGIPKTAAPTPLSLAPFFGKPEKPIIVSSVRDTSSDRVCVLDSGGQIWCWGATGTSTETKTQNVLTMQGAITLANGLEGLCTASATEIKCLKISTITQAVTKCYKTIGNFFSDCADNNGGQSATPKPQVGADTLPASGSSTETTPPPSTDINAANIPFCGGDSKPKCPTAGYEVICQGNTTPQCDNTGQMWAVQPVCKANVVTCGIASGE